MTASNSVPSECGSLADRLERLARRPLQPHRDELRALAKRLRAIEPIDHRVAHIELGEAV